MMISTSSPLPIIAFPAPRTATCSGAPSSMRKTVSESDIGYLVLLLLLDRNGLLAFAAPFEKGKLQFASVDLEFRVAVRALPGSPRNPALLPVRLRGKDHEEDPNERSQQHPNGEKLALREGDHD